MLRIIMLQVLIIPGITLFSQERVVIGNDAQRAILDEHNKERALVGSPDLKWDDSLAEYAYQWAYKLAKSDKDIHHRSKDEYGENISYWSGLPFTPEFGIRMWNDEKKDYRYGKYGKTSQKGMTGHYTQVVWYTTTKVGCGCAKSKKGGYYFVCNYSPPGNWIGEFPYKK